MLDFRAMPIATFKNVSIAFGKDEILSGADLVVHHGEHLALAGRNGAGKSTTLKLISGELKNDGGEIWTEKDLKFVSLPQQLPIATEESVFTAVSSVFDELGKVISEYQVLAKTIKVDEAKNEKLNELGYSGVFTYDESCANNLNWFYHLTGGHTHTDFFAIRPTDYSKANEGEDFEDIW